MHKRTLSIYSVSNAQADMVIEGYIDQLKIGRDKCVAWGREQFNPGLIEGALNASGISLFNIVS